MRKRIVWKPRVFLLFAFSLLLTLSLVACGADNGGTTSTVTPTPSPSATSVAQTPTAIAPATLVAYRGNGFTINYPQGWVVTEHTNGSVTFALPLHQTAKFLINVTENAHGVVTPESTVALGLNLFDNQTTNYQEIEVAPNITVGGVTWNQASATGDFAAGNVSQSTTTKVVVLATNYPQATTTTRTFLISYQTAMDNFDAMDRAYFQSMLQSFKFV